MKEETRHLLTKSLIVTSIIFLITFLNLGVLLGNLLDINLDSNKVKIVFFILEALTMFVALSVVDKFSKEVNRGVKHYLLMGVLFAFVGMAMEYRRTLANIDASDSLVVKIVIGFIQTFSSLKLGERFIK